MNRVSLRALLVGLVVLLIPWWASAAVPNRSLTFVSIPGSESAEAAWRIR